MMTLAWPSAANHFVLAWACHANNDRTAALRAIERALLLNPGNAEYLRLQGQIQLGN